MSHACGTSLFSQRVAAHTRRAASGRGLRCTVVARGNGRFFIGGVSEQPGPMALQHWLWGALGLLIAGPDGPGVAHGAM